MASRFIELPVIQDIRNSADQRDAKNLKEHGTVDTLYPGNQFCRSVGFIMQEVIAHVYPGLLHVDNTDYDYLYGSKRLDSKGFQYKFPPKPSYRIHVLEYAFNKDIDIFVFGFLLSPELATAWVVGYLPKEEYRRKSTYVLKGQRLGDYPCDSNQYIARVEDLREPNTLMDYLRSIP